MKESVLLFFSNAIGDAFMVLPTIRAFRAEYENVSIICDPNYLFLFQEINFTNVFLLEQIPNEKKSTISDTTIMEIKNHHFDYFVSLSSFHNDTIEKILAQYSFKRKIGYTGKCYDYELADPHCKTNMFDVYFKSIQYFNSDVVINNFNNKILPVSEILQASNFAKDFKIISIHTDTKPEKTWDSDNFIELISTIIRAYDDVLIVIIGMPKHDFTTISERILQFDTSLFEVSWEMLNLSDFFIGLDSCFMHLADINNIPSIVLFGETNVNEWGYRFNDNSVLITGEDNLVNMIQPADVFQVFSEKFEPFYSI